MLINAAPLVITFDFKIDQAGVVMTQLQSITTNNTNANNYNCMNTDIHSNIRAYSNSTFSHASTSNQVNHQKKAKKFALVVEGGGMRSIFSAGVLDSFFESGFDPFDLYLGVSAGSLNLASHLAGQYLRNYSVMMYCATSGQFISSWKYLLGGHFIDLDWLNKQCLETHPLDEQSAIRLLQNTGKTFKVVCTNLETGKPYYLCPDGKNIYDVLLGSCCVPLLYRSPVYISDVQVIDGGISDPIPIKKAYSEGCTDIIVIRTREKNYREAGNTLDKRLGYYLFRRYPKLQKNGT
jgi:predicted patatin/cPLA2 family phospholipase